MKHKTLPLPVGGDSPAGSSIRFWQQQGFRSRLDTTAVVLGMLLAAAGAWLSLNPNPIGVAIDTAGYHVDSMLLTPADGTSYTGPAAVLIRNEDGQLRAAAAGKLDGASMQGFCVEVEGTGDEQCIFVVGRRSFHATDHLAGGAWHRRYDDGQSVEIKVAGPGPPAPVPLPLGWRAQ